MNSFIWNHQIFNVSMDECGTFKECQNQILNTLKDKFNVTAYPDNLVLAYKNGTIINDIIPYTPKLIYISIKPISCKQHP